MFRMIGVLFFSVLVSVVVIADDFGWPDKHPCTNENIPLTTEKSVVKAVECLYNGRVAKVEQVKEGSSWHYEIRVLTAGGRVKTIDIHPQTGLPLDPSELEAVSR